jgi:hypothetical protein
MRVGQMPASPLNHFYHEQGLKEVNSSSGWKWKHYMTELIALGMETTLGVGSQMGKLGDKCFTIDWIGLIQCSLKLVTKSEVFMNG